MWFQPRHSRGPRSITAKARPCLHKDSIQGGYEKRHLAPICVYVEAVRWCHSSNGMQTGFFFSFFNTALCKHVFCIFFSKMCSFRKYASMWTAPNTVCRYTLKDIKKRCFRTGTRSVSLLITTFHFVPSLCASCLAFAVCRLQIVQLCVKSQDALWSSSAVTRI